MQRDEILDMFREDKYRLRMILDQVGVSSELLGIESDTSTGSNLKLLDSTTFENNLLMFLLTTLSTSEQHYQPLLEDIDNILDLINGELKNP